MNWIIYAGPYDETSGGSIALHKLADMLCRNGEVACLTTPKKNPEWMGGYADAYDVATMDYAVVIYPEIAVGNPLGQGFPTIRWILNTPGVMGGNGVFGPDDVVLLYSRYYSVSPKYKVSGILGVYEFKRDVFVDKGLERKGECYIVRKGRKKGLVSSGLRLDGYAGDAALVEAFNTRERFTSHDDVTMLSLFAAMCGCESVVIPGPLTADEWREKIPYLRYGVAYGDSQYERDRAKDTRSLIPENLLALEKESREQTLDMIQLMEAQCYAKA